MRPGRAAAFKAAAKAAKDKKAPCASNVLKMDLEDLFLKRFNRFKQF